MEYLQTQQRDRFRGDRYDLLTHNCNNFSHETAQFLTGRGIPQHILDLPNEVMSTPMGQMLAPMLQQMNPTGTSIPFSPSPASPAAPAAPANTASNTASPASARTLLPVTDYITFDAPLKVEGLAKKLEEFNSLEEESKRLDIGEVKIVLGIAKGLVRLSKENFEVLLKIRSWETKHTFPLLDILRYKSNKSNLEQPEQAGQVMLELFLSSLEPEFPVNCMLACKGLANLAATSQLSLQSLESILSPLPALLPAATPTLETALSSLLYNLSVLLVQQQNHNLETAILLSSSLASSLLLDLTQDENVYRGLVSLGNTLHASKAQEEVRQLLQSMDAGDLVSGLAARGEKSGQVSKEILALLNGSQTKTQEINLD